MPAVRHVVWDWNGTLFDDFDVVLAAMNEACRAIGGPAVSADLYRRLFTRPIELTYERLLGRPLVDGEWAKVNDCFHTAYNLAFRASAGLAPDALDALDRLRRDGVTQSLLSMWEHDELVPVVEAYGVAHYFVRIDGQPGRGGGYKDEHLRAHLDRVADALGSPLDPRGVVLVGDSLDDAHAAAASGIGCVLLDSGPHHVDALEAVGVPVAASLLDALVAAGAVGSGVIEVEAEVPASPPVSRDQKPR